MKTKITALAFILITVLTACANKDDPESDFLVNREENGITIIKYVGSKTAVNIPPIIQNLPVTSIGIGVFSGCTSLASITFQGMFTSANFDSLAFGIAILVTCGTSTLQEAQGLIPRQIRGRTRCGRNSHNNGHAM